MMLFFEKENKRSSAKHTSILNELIHTYIYVYGSIIFMYIISKSNKMSNTNHT